jgi:glycerol-3-phosphate dehydrogenase
LEQVFALNSDSIRNRIEKLNLVKEAIYERSYMIKNAEYLCEKIPFVIPSPNFFKTLYYYAGSVVYYLIYFYYAPKNTI